MFLTLAFACTPTSEIRNSSGYQSDISEPASISAASSGDFSSLASSEKGPIGSIPESSIISALELNEMLNGESPPFIVDTRKNVDFNINYITGSVNIPLSQLDVKLRELPTDQVIVFVCANDDHAEKCWRYLIEKGWAPSDVLVLYRGIDSWNEAGYFSENDIDGQILC